MANYWQDRFVQLEKAQMNKGIEYYHELEKQYSKAAEEVQKEIMKWYGRLAKNNEISVSEARKLLTKDELQEFKWSVETYIQKGRENDIDGRWMKELENASAKVHINRLEAMKLQMQQQVEMLYGNELDSFDKHIRDTYTEGFYRTAYEIQKGLGVGTNLSKLDTEKINKIIAKPWTADGSNFSSRIWKQKNQLVNELHNGLSQAFIRGTEPYDLTKQISERFKVSKGQAGRLVMTETAYFHSAAQIDAFKELGVKEYEITAVLDSRTSELCRDMDGKHLPVSEFKAGITAPPFHCWCRSTTVPYFNDEFTEEETRIARGADDKLYEVPYNMTYRQWEKKFVDGDKSGLKSVNKDNTIELKKKIADTDVQISELKKQFSDITEGYSYDDWFKDFVSIEDGYGDITKDDEPNVIKLKDITKKIKDMISKKNSLESQLPILGGQGKPFNITDAIKGANPNFGSDPSYRINCQRCVQAYEYRRRGFDVEALPKPKKKNTIIWGNECFVDSNGNTPQFKFNQSEAAVKNELKNAKEGSRYIIYVKWKKKSAHVFIAEKENGVIRYLDPQSNTLDASGHFSMGKENHYGFLRIDDKDITTDLKIINATMKQKR